MVCTAAHRPEDGLHLLWVADVEVAGAQRLKGGPGVEGASNTMVRETSTWRMEMSHE